MAVKKQHATTAKGARPAEAPVYRSLAEEGEMAVRTMTAAILDLGKLDDAPGLNDVRVELDAVSKSLWTAVQVHRGWERIVFAQAADLKLRVDLGPIAATCTACEDQALIIPEADGKGFAICRRCSFDNRR